MKNGFDGDRRRELLDFYFDLTGSLERLNQEFDRGGMDDVTEEVLRREIEEKRAAAGRLREEYLQGVPAMALSKCPFSGEVLVRSMDVLGIDGLWWDYDNPARRREELLPTFFAMAGALKPGSSLEAFPFTCSVGPEVPYVLPRLLKHEQIKAVLSSTAVGGHRLYLITYYAEPMIYSIRRVNDLGAYCYTYKNTQGILLHDYFEDPAKDFVLEEWIRAGKLLWIEPDDDSLTLRGFLTGCPYVNLQGSSKVQAIQGGKILEKEEPDWMVEAEEYLPDDSEGIPIQEIARQIRQEEESL
jgi:hypothetical protein